MKRIKFIIGILAIIAAVLAVFFVLRGDNALVTHPKGVIARRELSLIGTNYLLMLIIIVPTFVLLLVTAWKYRAKNTKAKYEPEKKHKELILWIIPSMVVAVMTVITWYATHELDPYQPLKSEVKPLKVQVVALDWKWLFIYPEQGIASVNFVQFPVGTPIHFTLCADGSPMNSFWLPQLSGQIYAMAGMATQIHMMADEPGEYAGRAAELNGQGLADMTFVAKATALSDFDHWVSSVKQSSLQLSAHNYNELIKPSQNHPVALYSSVEEDLFDKIVMKYMYIEMNSKVGIWQGGALNLGQAPAGVEAAQLE
jgi:cytochrome o ubiquinol oxidase subunit II